ncbi:MAG: PDR/VanB family oxidoreductase [Xanthobacteraceae bacterium]
MDTATASPPDQAHLPPAAASHLIAARLTDIQTAARDTKLYTFRRLDGTPLPPYKPGAHIDLHLPNGLVRQFSLVAPAPASEPDSYVVGVKRDDNSRGGSRYIIDEMKVGDEIKISAPRNNFPLVEDAEHVVLFAGGIGITPIWCMAQELAARGRSWKLYYACRSRADMAFVETLQKLDERSRHLHFDDEAGKVLDIAAAIAETPASAHLYCCGPNPMLKAFEAAAAGRPRNLVHVEYFTPKEETSAEAESKLGGFWVELARSGEEYFIPEGQKVLEVLFQAGVDVDYSCELGICGACETKVISGIPVHHDSVLSEEEQATNEKAMICCCGCKTERLVLDM